MNSSLHDKDPGPNHPTPHALRMATGLLVVTGLSCLLLAPYLWSGLNPAAGSMRHRFSILPNATSVTQHVVQTTVQHLLEELQESQQQQWKQLHDEQQRQAQQSNATSQLLQSIQNEMQQLVRVQEQAQQQGNLQPAANSSWPADLHRQTGHSCDGGFYIGPRQVFWKYVSDTLPTLSELYHAGMGLIRSATASPGAAHSVTAAHP